MNERLPVMMYRVSHKVDPNDERLELSGRASYLRSEEYRYEGRGDYCS